MRPISKEDVEAALHYDPVSGIFTWKSRPDSTRRWNSRWAGKQAGTKTVFDGRVVITIALKRYHAADLACLLMTGRHPEKLMDHIDLRRSNNAWSNLRQATTAENAYNTAKSKRNKSGYKGVRYNHSNKGWCSEIQFEGKRKYLGTFSSPEAAHAAYAEASARFHGRFGRTS